MSREQRGCPDCHAGSDATTRREFVRSTAAAGIAIAAGGWLGGQALAAGEGKAAAAPETLVQQLYNSLKPDQRKKVCFSFDDPLRSKVDNNWHITEARVQSHFDADQQALIKQIFLGLHSEEYAEKVLAQVEHDGGFDKCAIALFGQPGSGKFEFVLTGRHVTRRCDGDSVAGAAFGGPIFYGHAARDFNEPADHEGNIYWYQAQRANELFQALDGKQREQALLGDSRGENGTETVKVSGKQAGLPGIPFSELSPDQKELARKVMADVLAPFRATDREESLKLVEKNGWDHLHVSYYKNEDIGYDRVWDVWQIEGPAMVWYFRGLPHVHTWVNIQETAAS